jgi:hypothetical protein
MPYAYTAFVSGPKMTKKRRSISSTTPRYPREDVGRRRFLRELGLGAAAIAALPLVACSDDTGAPPMPDARVDQRILPDSGVAPFPDARIDGIPWQPDAIDAVRPDGGIPDGAGTDGKP